MLHTIDIYTFTSAIHLLWRMQYSFSTHKWRNTSDKNIINLLWIVNIVNIDVKNIERNPKIYINDSRVSLEYKRISNKGPKFVWGSQIRLGTYRFYSYSSFFPNKSNKNTAQFIINNIVIYPIFDNIWQLDSKREKSLLTDWGDNLRRLLYKRTLFYKHYPTIATTTTH